MKLISKIFLASVVACFISNAFADIKVRDYTKDFVEGYYHLRTKNQRAYLQYILRYELIAKPQVCSIFFDGHPIPHTPSMDSQLNTYAKHLPDFVHSYEQKAPEVKEIVAEVQERTQRLFGININANVVLSTSVSRTDAVTTGSEGTIPTVALNMREMSQYSKDELRIVLSHELFHVLQHQIESDHSNAEPIAGNLYSEGWATYASSLVYPGFEDWKYISYFTKNNRQFMKFEADRKAIIHNLMKDWNAHSPRKYDKYFSADNYACHPFEPRSGYYIGYIAAKTLAEQQSPVKVALIKYSDFKRQIKPLLKKMADEPRQLG